MTTVLIVAVCAGVSLLAAVAFAFGGSVGYRRGFEDGRTTARRVHPSRVIVLDEDVTGARVA